MTEKKLMMARLIRESSEGVVPPSTNEALSNHIEDGKKLSGESCDQNHADLTLLVHVFLSSTLL